MHPAAGKPGAGIQTNGTASRPVPAGQAAPSPFRRDAVLLLALVALVGLVVAAEGCWVLPGLSAVQAETRRLKEEFEWARQRDEDRETLLESSRQRVINQQATLLSQQEQIRRQSEENARLVDALNKKLRESNP